MRVLIGYEVSARVRDAFRRLGHDAWSADILPTFGDPHYHYLGRVQNIADESWDVGIFFPPCTHLSVSGALHFHKKRDQQEAALSEVRWLMNLPIKKIAIENPVGVISTRIRKPDQIIQPWQFGENASKKTCLWLQNLPHLVPTKIMEPGPNGRYGNQTSSGQNKLGPSPQRAMIRGLTYQGIADAMAAQWSPNAKQPDGRVVK